MVIVGTMVTYHGCILQGEGWSYSAQVITYIWFYQQKNKDFLGVIQKP